jgi:hypothetical protein
MAAITGPILFPENAPVFVISKDPDRAPSRGEGFPMMVGAGELTGPAAKAKLRGPADFHSESKVSPNRYSYYIHVYPHVNMIKVRRKSFRFPLPMLFYIFLMIQTLSLPLNKNRRKNLAFWADR